MEGIGSGKDRQEAKKVYKMEQADGQGGTLEDHQDLREDTRDGPTETTGPNIRVREQREQQADTLMEHRDQNVTYEGHVSHTDLPHPNLQGERYGAHKQVINYIILY